MEAKKIVITGAAGFIGSCLAGRLNALGYGNLVLADEFSREDKRPNWAGKQYAELVERDLFPEWLTGHAGETEFVFHLGARTDTTETDEQLFDRLNLKYSQAIWQTCARAGIPMIYASSAATYGLGKHGYTDDHTVAPRLEPLNAYGRSKQAFDLWALTQQEAPPFWAGLKFFNVYGPNEYHKGRMASVVFHSYRQIRERGYVNLFRSHHPDYADGEQQRDFVYVMDVVDVILWLRSHRDAVAPGLYNVGTGEARSFLELAKGVFAALDLEPDIRFIDTPEDIRASYQYYSCADLGKLRGAGYARAFTLLENGIREYVQVYLAGGRYF